MDLKEIFRRILRRDRRQSTDVYLRRSQNYYKRNSIYLDNIYNKISTDVAMLRFKHVKVTRHENAVDEMQWFEQSDLAQVLTVSPNDHDTPIVFWSDVVRTMLKDGVAVVVPRYEKGVLTEIHLANKAYDWGTHSVKLRIDDFDIELDINNVWIFKNPKQNLSAQLTQITNIIDANLMTISNKLDEQNSWLKGFLKLGTKAADKELQERVKKRIESIMETAQNGGIGYLEQGEEFQELNNVYSSASSDDLEFLKSQLYNGFGINEKLFTCDYTEEQYRAYFSSVLKLYQRVIDEEINRKYFSKTARTQGHKLVVYYDMTDITSLKDLSEFTFKAKYSGLMNSNELREMYLGLPGYAGGEVFESNKNAVQVGDMKGGET